MARRAPGPSRSSSAPADPPTTFEKGRRGHVMPNTNSAHSRVRRTRISAGQIAAALAFLDNVCATGAQCAEVQNDPMAKQALGDLQTRVTATHATFASKGGLQIALTAATKTLGTQASVAERAIGTYETAVSIIAYGSAPIIRGRAVPRATNYTVEITPSPQNPAGPWASLGAGASRRRVVTGPAPKSQLLARVAALGSDGTQT